MSSPLTCNYHTHTRRCKHATGEDADYVKLAIEAGIKVLGFSDHTPYPIESDFTSGMRMGVEETKNYFDSITALKEKYVRKIKIYCGVEAEYFPEHFDRLLNLLKDYPCDYMILANHFVPDEENGTYVGAPFKDPEILDLYLKNTLAGIESGKFAYLAHPDLPNYVGLDANKRLPDLYRTICEACKEANLPVEANFLGWIEHRNYPTEKFFKIAAGVGNDVIIGLDAHDPHFLNDTIMQKQFVRWLEKQGCHIIDHLEGLE